MTGKPTCKLLFLLAILLAGCTATPVENPHPSVLVIAVDGLEWDVVLPLLQDGRMPALAGLMERGTFGEVESMRPTKSPIIWTSVATGQIADKHGITGFLESSDEGVEPRLFTNRDRKTRAVWNILSDRDRRVAVVGWWMTYPVEEINGVMVAQANTSSADDESKIWKGTLYEDLRGQVHPPEREQEILTVLPQVEADLADLTRRVFGEVPENLGHVPQVLWDKCEWAFRADEIYRRTALRLLKEDPEYDLFMVYVGGTDVVGHRFWRYSHPDEYADRPTEDEIRVLGDVIDDYYVHADRVIGELIDAAPEESTVIVVSDHGMEGVSADRRFTEDLPPHQMRSAGHRGAPPGLLVAAGPGIRRSDHERPVSEIGREDLPSLGSVLDLAPTLLFLQGIPVGRDMDGAVMKPVVDPVYLDQHPVQFVDTHTPPGWFEARGDRAVESPASEERIEQLRSLGYIGGGNDDSR